MMSIALRYFEGRLLVDPWISLADQSSAALAREIRESVAKQLELCAYLAKAAVLCVPNDMQRPCPYFLAFRFFFLNGAIGPSNNHFTDTSA